MTAPGLTKTAIAPAMKNAGTRQSTTCSRAYHLASASASTTALSNRSTPTGSQKHSPKTASNPASFFHSSFQANAGMVRGPAVRCDSVMVYSRRAAKKKAPAVNRGS
jgi:hypothetical protein